MTIVLERVVLERESTLSTQEERIVALEKNATIMKQDFVYKLGEVNRNITMLQVSFTVLNEDIGLLKLRMQDMKEDIDRRFDGVDIRFNGVNTYLENRFTSVDQRLDEQGQDIKDIKQRLDTQDSKLDDILNLLRSNGNAS